MFPIDMESLYPLVQPVGWALVHFLWQGALVGLVYALGHRLLAGSRPQRRYAWGLTHLVILAALPPATGLWLMNSPTAVEVTALPAMTAVTTAELASPTTWRIEGLLPWVVAAWAIGVLLMSARVMVNWRRMRRLVHVGVHPLSDQINARVSALCEVFAIRRAVQVLESTVVRVPTVLGWLKPVILLPTSSVVGLTPRQLELVIAHEIGHIQRLDYLVNLFQVAVETLLFYHPVVNWISRQIRDEREKCCDDLVIETCGHRLDYAKALTNLETMRSGSLVPALAATDGQLLERIERIVCHHTARNKDAAGGGALLVLALAAVIVMAGQLADPLARMDAGRQPIAERLVNELMTLADRTEPLAMLEDARGEWVEPPAPVETVAVPTAAEPLALEASVESSAVSPATTAARAPATPYSRPVDEPVTRSAPAAPEASVPTAVDDRRVATVVDAPRILPDPVQLPLAAAPVRQSQPRVEDPQPAVLKRAAPVYPVRARIAGLEGYVLLEFQVGEDGKPSEVRIIDSSPRRVFDKSARRAIREWRFDPTVAGVDGQRLTQRFDFSLKGEAQSTDAGRSCVPVTGTRICRSESPTALLSEEAAGG